MHNIILMCFMSRDVWNLSWVFSIFPYLFVIKWVNAANQNLLLTFKLCYSTVKCNSLCHPFFWECDIILTVQLPLEMSRGESLPTKFVRRNTALVFNINQLIFLLFLISKKRKHLYLPDFIKASILLVFNIILENISK